MQIGDVVIHQEHGTGIILWIDKYNEGQTGVTFNHGTKICEMTDLEQHPNHQTNYAYLIGEGNDTTKLYRILPDLQ